MNTQQENQVADVYSANHQLISVGKALREAREQMGLSVNDVANRIKFAPRQIESLEADDFIRLPEAAFVRGFVRSYARLLELDPTRLLSSLPSSHVQASTNHEIKSVEIPMPSAFSARRHNIVWLAAALVVALSLAIFERLHDRSPSGVKQVVKNAVEPLELPNIVTEAASAPLSDQAVEAASVSQEVVRAEPVVAHAQKSTQTTRAVPVTESKPRPAGSSPVVRTSPEAAPRQSEVRQVTRAIPAAEAPQKQVPQQIAPVAPTQASVAPPRVAEKPKAGNEISATEHALRIELDEDAWVEVKDGNDKLLVSKMHSAGSLVRVVGKSPMLVTIGNARAVRLFDNGKKIKLERYTTAEVAKVKLK